jgi:diguanylate cyclase (GGDEF)-like protein
MALRSPLGRQRGLAGSALSASAVELPAVDVPLLWTPLVAGALACIGYIVHLVTGAGGETLGVVLLVGAYAGALLAGIVVTVWRGGGPGVLVSFAVAGYAVSSGSYALFVNAPESFPSVYDIGLLAFYPLSSLALIAIVHRQIGELSGGRWLDSLLGAIAIAALGAAAVFPLLGGNFDSSVASQFLYLVADLMFVGFLLTAYALSGWRDQSVLWVLGTGAGMLVVGDAVYVVAVAHGATVAPSLTMAVWPAALLLMTAAPYLKLHRVAQSSPTWAIAGIPAASAAVALPVTVFAEPGTPPQQLAIVALTLAVVRFVLTLRQNTHLLSSIHAAAITDALTGLANRRRLSESLEVARARQADDDVLGVLFLDLDEFKTINDVHGHEAGDSVLIAVAERLRAAVRRSSGTIARLGGDEFVVLLEGLRSPADAVPVADRILAEVRAPFHVGGHTLHIETSIGITHADARDDRAAADLLRDADTAMYEAKRAGKHRHQLFASEMQERLLARNALTRDLREAITGNQLRLLYQPQVDLASGVMTGVEALVRWEHPEQGLLTPDRFIPAAESAGILADIDDWVLWTACAQLRAWDDAGVAPLELAVNVSAGRLARGDLAAVVGKALGDFELDPRRLEVEVTETVAVEHDAAAVATLAAVRELGVSVAIDDFGMGHSSLNRLQTFPVDRLKIDRSFVAHITTGAARGSLVEAITTMGQSLGLEVIAEGVETHDHLEALLELGCPSAQGYLFSRPVGPDEIAMHARSGTMLAAHAGSSSGERERRTRTLLAELQRLTGLESTYLTRIDWSRAVQYITHARNTGVIDIPEGRSVDWSDAVCRRALEQGVRSTDDVPATFPDSDAARELGLQTYIGVPVLNASGELEGTLCGVSSRRLELGPEAIRVMEEFARLIAADSTTAAS